MGAMDHDLNRCNFMYADDRRCRNLVQTPGDPFCCYHSDKVGKVSRDARANASAAQAFFDWLARHPLDTATHLQHTLNLLIFLVVSNRISGRQAETLLRAIRLMAKTIPEAYREFSSTLRQHDPRGEQFLREIRKTLLPAIRGETEPPLDSAPIPPPTLPDPAPPFPPEPFSSQPIEAPPPAPAAASPLSSPAAPVAARAPQGGSGRPAKVKRMRSAPRRPGHRRHKPRRRLGPASGLANGFAAMLNGIRTTPPSQARVAKLARALGKRSGDPFRAAEQETPG